MNSIRQNVPGFVSGVEPGVAEFETVEELLRIPFVSCFRENNGTPFYRFSKSKNLLMAERDDGYSWWVVGYISNPDAVRLPEWNPKYGDARRV